MKRYPEYFIGGPLDGQDKNERFPSLPEWEAVKIKGVDTGLEIHAIESGTPIEVDEWEWHYYCHRIRLGGTVVKYWYDSRLLSREVVALRFWELILSPHAIKVDLTKEGTPS